MSFWTRTITGILILAVLGNWIGDALKWLALRAWPHRQLALSGARRVVWPNGAIRLRRIVVGLVASLTLALSAQALPPAVVSGR
jgi:hypothetical protein